VTDANLLSGILHPHALFRAAIRLNPDKAREVIESLADEAGLSIEETIRGVRSVVNANMLRGIRRTTVEKGIDVRDCTLLAFGGAGPIHAAELAGELGMKEVLIPPMAGMFSALGILLSDVKLDFGQTYMAKWNGETQQEVERMIRRFKKKAFKSIDRQGLDREDTYMTATLDMRYEGQSFHLPVPYSKGIDMVERFYKAFRNRYGYNLPQQKNTVQIVTVRLSAVTPRGEIPLPEAISPGQNEPSGKRDLLLPFTRENVPVFYRRNLGLSFSGLGPLVVEDEGCTIFVPPACEISMEKFGCLKITPNRH
jgi:N-methylhydantoinase A